MKITKVLGTGLMSALLFVVAQGDALGQRRRRTACPEGQHESAGQCCHEGEEWVQAREACICLAGPGRCGAGASATPAPPPSNTSNTAPPPALQPTQQPAQPPPVQPAPSQPEAQYTCAEGTVLVRGQSFQMGSRPGEGDPDETPAHRATVGAYCIDRTEVTVGQYRACMQAGTCSLHTTVNLPGLSPQDQALYNQYCNGARTDRDTHPINCVDWSQADAFCRSRNGRLPTEAEWELGARGAEGRVYPWGSAAPSRLMLNGCDADCLSLFERPGRPRGRALHDSTDGFGTTAPVGTFAGGASPFGLMDTAGNVMEWVGDWYGPYNAAPVIDPTGPASGSSRIVRGGHWLSSAPAAVRGADRVETAPATRLATLGFRCVLPATPVAAPPPPPVEPTPAPENSGPRRRHHH